MDCLRSGLELDALHCTPLYVLFQFKAALCVRFPLYRCVLVESFFEELDRTDIVERVLDIGNAQGQD